MDRNDDADAPPPPAERPRRAPQSTLLVPVGAAPDPELNARVAALGERLPESLPEIRSELEHVEPYAEFDAALLLVRDLVYRHLDALVAAPTRAFFELLDTCFPADDCGRIARALLRHPHTSVRRRAVSLLRRKQPTDIGLPLEPGGEWSWQGWTRGAQPGRLFRHARGSRRQQELGVPQLANVGEVRALLGVRSPAQLGWLLTASSGEGRPYHSFEIPKRDGRLRHIAAPGGQLRAVQRRILAQILEKIPPHDAAHGFIGGRSTVTNARVHLGRQLLVKFDLKDFFPTIHYWRLVGLFAHLGYDLGDARFSSDDDSRSVAPVLARLCSWTPNPRAFGQGHAPQGAPTSPALSNLVCRGLDARLCGLAQRLGGRYTRYADDLTFSFDAEPERGLGRFRWWVEAICQQEGFTINSQKFRVVRRSQRQLVTGIVVNDALRVPREARRRFRAILHNCERLGLASQARGRSEAELADYLRGFASYLHMVHPEEGTELLAQVEALLGSDRAVEGERP